VLTEKQKLDITEQFENRELGTKLAKIMGQELSDCMHEVMLPGQNYGVELRYCICEAMLQG
jgi:hypothetical protein